VLDRGCVNFAEFPFRALRCISPEGRCSSEQVHLRFIDTHQAFAREFVAYKVFRSIPKTENIRDSGLLRIALVARRTAIAVLLFDAFHQGLPVGKTSAMTSCSTRLAKVLATFSLSQSEYSSVACVR
jgi:hypothetical protein